jgi:hypothetical protein
MCISQKNNRPFKFLIFFLSIVIWPISQGYSFSDGEESSGRNQNPPQVKKYNFSTTYHDRHISVWGKVLSPFKNIPNVNYLEIGVFEGRSAIWMLENILTHETSRMTCIDIFTGDLKDKFFANLKISGFEHKVKTIIGSSQIELAKLTPNSFDIIYIDGSHVAGDVLIDAVLSWVLLKDGGLIIFDDYLLDLSFPVELRPQVAVDSFITVFRNLLDVVYHSNQVIIRKEKRSPWSFPFGQFAFYWGGHTLRGSNRDQNVKLSNKEKEIVERVILSRKLGEVAYSPDRSLLSDESFLALENRLNLKLDVNRESENDVPIRGDFNGDGKIEVALYRTSSAIWLGKDQFVLFFGMGGDIPVAADYDGNGTADIAIFRPATGMWMVKDQFRTPFGSQGDVPVPGDYDGNGTADIAVFRPATGMWMVKDQFRTPFGGQGDIPVPDDYDRNGKVDIAVYQPSSATWAVRNLFKFRFATRDIFPLVR